MKLTKKIESHLGTALFERKYIRWNEELQSILQYNGKLSKEQLAEKLAASIANREQTKSPFQEKPVNSGMEEIK
jgi:hypothetical protein